MLWSLGNCHLSIIICVCLFNLPKDSLINCHLSLQGWRKASILEGQLFEWLFCLKFKLILKVWVRYAKTADLIHFVSLKCFWFMDMIQYHWLRNFPNSSMTSWPTFLTFIYLVMNGCLKMSLISILSSGSFLQIFRIK